jgi:hypothetical protein
MRNFPNGMNGCYVDVFVRGKEKREKVEEEEMREMNEKEDERKERRSESILYIIIFHN